ncbi:MAG: SDR family NAD(P)-dependent oxidoreductase [Promethearchaeota archaeon]
MNKILQGKIVYIIGASTGIGKAIALGFAELGAKVGLVSRSKDRLESNVKKINEIYGNEKENDETIASYAPADISDYNMLKNAIESLVNDLGAPDVLINNAAIAPFDQSSITRELIDKVIDVNLKGALYASSIVSEYFAKKKGGSIINTSSIAGLDNWGGASPLYDITKAGLNRFTTTTLLEYDSKKIRINSILPGWVETPLIKDIPKNVIDSLVEGTGVRMLKPEEIVPYYVFFASDKSKRISHKLVNVVSFMRAFKYIDTLDKDVPRNFDSLKDILQKNVSYGTFSNVKKNRKLFDFILNYENIIKK